MNTIIIHKFQNLPEAAQAIILDFIEFLTIKHKKSSGTHTEKNKKQKFNFKWEGALSAYKNQFTSVELQHKTSEWRNT